MNFPRVDLFFSYWVFFWFILYYFQLVPYNPKWFLVIGLMLNIMLILGMIWYSNSWLHVAFFVFVNSLTKAVPVWLIWETVSKWEDFAFGVGLGMLYVMYFRFIMGSFSGPILKMIKNIQDNKPVSPVLFWLEGHSGFPS